MDFCPEYAYNNTYGEVLIAEEAYEAALAASPTCKNMIAMCRSLWAAKGLNEIGNEPDVNAACKGAFLNGNYRYFLADGMQCSSTSLRLQRRSSNVLC